ncbi:heavy metal-associated isoprenylated plant protein 47-like [Alnus glutinosa]|uniref:heavy metal-associated isoprenylated plant protein 47-like n=1 Tax=Alnus glutinosa TaxID=3517 RepID=UPI002D791E33|nr:heavy metal-associated isoprenylated plant protein 47-like [Alnus glutinosa]
MHTDQIEFSHESRLLIIYNCFRKNMKQKIVIKVQMSSAKCRTKAMKIAATTDGVSSVAIQGSDNDQLVVSGQDVDSVKLTRSLRKKLCYATILTVEEEKEKDADTTEEQVEPKFPACNYQPYPKYYEVVYDPYQNNCSIL